MDFNLHYLLGRAIWAAENSYSPYSKYKVGAALITSSGEIFSGANIENASYGLTICAERTALFKAISSGISPLDLIAIAIATKDGGTSCGACRQVMSEFNRKMFVYFATINDLKEVTNLREFTVAELLPSPFCL